MLGASGRRGTEYLVLRTTRAHRGPPAPVLRLVTDACLLCSRCSQRVPHSHVGFGMRSSRRTEYLVLRTKRPDLCIETRPCTEVVFFNAAKSAGAALLQGNAMRHELFTMMTAIVGRYEFSNNCSVGKKSSAGWREGRLIAQNVPFHGYGKKSLPRGVQEIGTEPVGVRRAVGRAEHKAARPALIRPSATFSRREKGLVGVTHLMRTPE
jgi:hypothetical protein